MKRDPRVRSPRPEIRNFRPPKRLREHEETPWDRLQQLLDALETDRADRILDHVKEACFEEGLSFRELTWTAYEAVTRGANEELRQVLTTVQHRLQLNLRETEPGEPPLTWDEAWDLLQTVKTGTRLLEAQAPRGEIACAFLDLDPEGVELSDLVRRRLSLSGLKATVETSYEPAPVKVDPERFGEALLVFLDSFLPDEDEAQPVLDVRWEGSEAYLFLGARPPTEPKHLLQDRLNKAASLQDPELDVPLARAVIEHHGGGVHVHERGQARGVRLVLPALEPGPANAGVEGS